MFHWWKKHTADGLEKPDPTPLEVDVTPPLTLQQQIARFTTNQAIQQELRERGLETFEEADDLEVDTDGEPVSPYEREFEGPESPLHVQTRMDEIKGGMVEDETFSRLDRARSALEKHKKQNAKPEAAQST